MKINMKESDSDTGDSITKGLGIYGSVTGNQDRIQGGITESESPLVCC